MNAISTSLKTPQEGEVVEDNLPEVSRNDVLPIVLDCGTNAIENFPTKTDLQHRFE